MQEKIWYGTLTVITLIVGACALFGPVTPVEPVYDVILKNDETGNKNYGPAKDDKERCDLLRAALKELKPSDTVLLGKGNFDCDCKGKGTVFFPDQISVLGTGESNTKLFSNCWSDDQGSAFEIKNGTFQDLTFENQTWDPYEDGRTIEFFAGLKRTPDNAHYAHDASGNKIIEVPNPGPFTADFRRVRFVGNAWVVYDWSGRGHTWRISDSIIVSGRQGVSLMSGGGNYQNAEIIRTVFDIDTSRSADIGWTSNQSVGGGYGVVARGGRVKVIDCVFNILCEKTGHPASYIPRCVGLFDGHNFGSSSSAWTYLEVQNPKFNVRGPGSKEVFDIYMTNAGAIEKLKLEGGTGSGPAGVITKNW